MSKDERKYKTEWSFSFENLGESISNSLEALGIGDDVELKTVSFVEPLDSATKARVVLEPSVGDVRLKALSDSDHLFEADITYVGEIKFDVRPEGSGKALRLHHELPRDVLQPIKDTLGSLSHRDELKWIMGLTPDIPLDIQINTGITDSELDLSALQVVALGVTGGTGRIDLKLPTMGSQYPVHVNSGTGRLDIDIPDGASLDLHVNNGTGRTEIHVGTGVTVTGHVTGGVGKCALVIPAEAAVRLRGSTGLGKIRLPEHFVAVKVDQFVATSGIWETPGYAEAEHKIDLRYEGGVGALQIETA